MKIYVAFYDYENLDGDLNYGNTYAGHDLELAKASLKDEEIMKRNEELIYSLKGGISKYIEEWESGQIVRFVLSERK